MGAGQSRLNVQSCVGGPAALVPGANELHAAVARGRSDLVRKMLTSSNSNVNVPDCNGDTALHMAARLGREEILPVLLASGANPAATNKERKLPLHLAASNGHVSTVRLLVAAAPASVQGCDADGNSPLHLAAMAGHNQIVRIVGGLAKGALDDANLDGDAAVHLAASAGHAACVEQLARLGANVNATDKHSRPALHRAVEAGSAGATAALLEAGADVEAKDGAGATAAHLAAGAGRQPVLEALLQARASVAATNSSGATPLHLAAAAGHGEAVRALAAAKADMDAGDAHFDTPLHLAAAAGHTAAVRALLECGAGCQPVNAKPVGRTPLHVAAEAGHVEAITLIKGAGANVDVQDAAGQTPLHLAAVNGKVSAVSALLAAGASVHVRDSVGKTPVQLALMLDNASMPSAGETKEVLLSAAAAAVTPKWGGEGSTPFSPSSASSSCGEQNECSLCLGKVEEALEECGHRALCPDCTAIVRAGPEEHRKCPTCSMQLEGVSDEEASVSVPSSPALAAHTAMPAGNAKVKLIPSVHAADEAIKSSTIDVVASGTAPAQLEAI